MHVQRFSLCAAILFLAASGSAQSVSFNSPRTYPSSVEAGPVAQADFHGDGKAGLFIAFGYYIGVLLGNGDGTFQPPSMLRALPWVLPRRWLATSMEMGSRTWLLAQFPTALRDRPSESGSAMAMERFEP